MPFIKDHEQKTGKKVMYAFGISDTDPDEMMRKHDVVLREGDAPLLGLFAMVRSGDLPEAMRGQTWREPALVIRGGDGRVHPEYAAVKLSFGFPP